MLAFYFLTTALYTSAYGLNFVTFLVNSISESQIYNLSRMHLRLRSHCFVFGIDNHINRCESRNVPFTVTNSIISNYEHTTGVKPIFTYVII